MNCLAGTQPRTGADTLGMCRAAPVRLGLGRGAVSIRLMTAVGQLVVAQRKARRSGGGGRGGIRGGRCQRRRWLTSSGVRLSSPGDRYGRGELPETEWWSDVSWSGRVCVRRTGRRTPSGCTAGGARITALPARHSGGGEG